jgi:hypothetical protein
VVVVLVDVDVEVEVDVLVDVGIVVVVLVVLVDVEDVVDVVVEGTYIAEPPREQIAALACPPSRQFGV